MGMLYVTEYPNMGDVSPTKILEPSDRTQHVPFGEISATFKSDTRVVTFWADLPCKVRFFAGEPDPTELLANAYPVTERTEMERLVHLNSHQRVAVFDMDD